MSETVKKETIIGYITLEDGTKKEVLEQKGKFYICKETQGRVKFNILLKE